MLDDLLELAAVIALACGVVAVLFVVIWGIGLLVDHQQCRAKSTVMHLESDWGVFSGCMVNVGDQFIPLKAYEARTIEQNIKIK